MDTKEENNYEIKLKEQLAHAYSISKTARSRRFDPSEDVEVKIASDVADRVENIVGPPGIADIIRQKEKTGMSREDITFELAQSIAKGEIFKGSEEKRMEQAIRTAVGLLTEGVLVAPTEGISKVIIKSNPDGSNYLAIYYAGPIRSAGGTAMALSVMVADSVRKLLGIADFRPTDTQIERYVEEINTYEARVNHLQYKPPEEDVRFLLKHCPICIDGDPTEEVEVSAYRDVPGIETNRIRGGMPLVLCEGIAQKANKLLKYSKKLNLGWEWLESIIKITRSKDQAILEPQDNYLEGLVAGRPVFSYPSRAGGFRLRYGRARNNGLMAKCIHPAAMSLVDDFLAVGTHMKIERPGKGCVITPYDGLEPPVVKLQDGTVIRLTTVAQAEMLKEKIEKILFLGDILITYGDFLKSNHPLLPSGICEEWWLQELRQKNIELPSITAASAFQLSKAHGIPLHPDYTFNWHDISIEQLAELIPWLDGKHGNIPSIKQTLEKLLIEHTINNGKIIIPEEILYAFNASLGIGTANANTLKEKISKVNNALDAVNILSGIKILAKAPTYIGARMGRPEKAKPRKMDGSPNVLFPTGSQKNRSLSKLYKMLKTKEGEKTSQVEIARYRCTSCNAVSLYARCHICMGEANLEKICVVCKQITKSEIHCDKPTASYDIRPVDLVALFNQWREKFGFVSEEIKGVKGLSNARRMPERLEKGFLRAKHGVHVFRDGTARFDATNAPLTHFTPKETGVSIEKLKSLGYSHDYLGNELKHDGQLLLLFPQDIILSDGGAEYFLKVTNFIDDLLLNLYGLHAFYNCKSSEDLVGHLIATLSPHTSAAVLGRIIGFTKAHVGYGHPYTIAARRRNADGDEDSTMLLMDALLNFSRGYLDEKRGGSMDAPLVLTPIIDPSEVDDEVHGIEILSNYPLDFYYATLQYKYPSEIKLPTVKDTLGSEKQFNPFNLTHHGGSMHEGNISTTYVGLKSVPEKIGRQFALQDKLVSVDQKDAAQRLIASHFIPDLYGNLHSFSRQAFRCGNCNASYRRVPLVGKCLRCGGNLLLTIHKGGIQKYLEISKDIVKRYDLSSYTKQLIDLVEKEIVSIFEDEKEKQTDLADFV